VGWGDASPQSLPRELSSPDYQFGSRNGVGDRARMNFDFSQALILPMGSGMAYRVVGK